MTDKPKLYEGKAKILYDNGDGTLTQYFKDSATAFNNQKKDEIADKGRLNNLISERIMTELNNAGLPTHFIKRIDDRSQQIRKLNIIPLEVIVRNKTAGTLCKRYGLEEGRELPTPIVEYSLKNDELGDPIIPQTHIIALNITSQKNLAEMESLALGVNNYIGEIFRKAKLTLIDFKLEFGTDNNENIYIADEISPDTCRLWDAETNKKLDKDRFRQDLGSVIEAYKEVANRLGIQT